MCYWEYMLVWVGNGVIQYNTTQCKHAYKIKYFIVKPVRLLRSNKIFRITNENVFKWCINKYTNLVMGIGGAWWWLAKGRPGQFTYDWSVKMTCDDNRISVKFSCLPTTVANRTVNISNFIKKNVQCI